MTNLTLITKIYKITLDMKHFKSIALIALIPLLSFCTNQRSEKSRDIGYTSAELLGKWNRVYSDKLLKDTDINIEFIQLVNDSIAEVQINDLNGERKVIGTWINKFEKEIGKTGIKIKSDISITYFIDEHHPHMLLLRLNEKNEKLIMISGNYKFQKE